MAAAVVLNTVYPSEVLANKLQDNLTTHINHRDLMTIDRDLTENEGMTKRIITYAYGPASGNDSPVEKLLAGNKNAIKGKVTASSTYKTVQRVQQTWAYTDDEFYADNDVVEAGMRLSANEMVNDMVADFYTAAATASLTAEFPEDGFTYDAVVDAIAEMNLEDESGLFLVINPGIKAEIRKDADFKAKELGKVIRDGMIGSLAGVPVIVSKAVPEDTAYLMTKEAITCFLKKDVSVEQDRDIEAKINTIVEAAWYIVALTDATKIVKMERASE